MPWEKNGTPNTLNVTGDLLSVDDLTAQDTSVLLCHALNSGTIDINITFDDDTGSNYATRTSSDGGSDSTSTSRANLNTGGDAADSFHVYYTVNLANQEKLLTGDKVDLSSTGAGTAPQRREQTGKWVNTTDQFTSVEFDNAGAGSFVADSNLSILSDVPTIPETVGGWVELGRTTLGSAGDDITVSGLSDKRYYMYLINEIGTGSSGGNIQLGSGSVDGGSNYAYRYSSNGSTDATAASQTHIETRVGYASSLNTLDVGYVANLSDKEKLVQHFRVEQNTAGAANAPPRNIVVGKWDDDTDPLTVINNENDGSGDFSADSELVVLGWDPNDTHTGNFWEELASADLSGGASDTLDSGTFTAKKYLWIQIYTIGTNTEQQFRFNSDSGNNYASRRSFDGGTDDTTTSSSMTKINATGSAVGGCLCNCFVVNNATEEKLAIAHQVAVVTTGAGTAPPRSEAVFKWTNTTDQITSVQGINNSIGDFGTASIIKVWGAD